MTTDSETFAVPASEVQPLDTVYEGARGRKVSGVRAAPYSGDPDDMNYRWIQFGPHSEQKFHVDQLVMIQRTPGDKRPATLIDATRKFLVRIETVAVRVRLGDKVQVGENDHRRVIALNLLDEDTVSMTFDDSTSTVLRAQEPTTVTYPYQHPETR